MVTHFPRNMRLRYPLLKQDSLYALLMISNKDALHDNGTGMTYTAFFFNTNAGRFFNQLVHALKKRQAGMVFVIILITSELDCFST